MPHLGGKISGGVRVCDGKNLRGELWYYLDCNAGKTYYTEFMHVIFIQCKLDSYH